MLKHKGPHLLPVEPCDTCAGYKNSNRECGTQSAHQSLITDVLYVPPPPVCGRTFDVPYWANDGARQNGDNGHQSDVLAPPFGLRCNPSCLGLRRPKPMAITVLTPRRKDKEPVKRFEVFTGTGRRCEWGEDEIRQIIEESYSSDLSVCAVDAAMGYRPYNSSLGAARRGNSNRNVLLR